MPTNPSMQPDAETLFHLVRHAAGLIPAERRRTAIIESSAELIKFGVNLDEAGVIASISAPAEAPRARAPGRINSGLSTGLATPKLTASGKRRGRAPGSRNRPKTAPNEPLTSLNTVDTAPTEISAVA